MERDERFKHVSTDPKFRRLPQKDRKVKIDKRFQTMFKDPKFNVRSHVDKRGRPVTFGSTENYKKYYDLSSSDEGDSDDGQEMAEDDNQAAKKRPIENKGTSSDASNDAEEEDAVLKIDEREKEIVSGSIREKLKDLSVDYARGGGQIFSDDSSSSEESNEEEEGSDDLEHAWGELDKDAERTEEATCRLAVCNMDWNRVKSDDLIVLLNSFVPAGGTIKNVSVYQSEFGKQCMLEEDAAGPKELAQQLVKETGEDDFDVEKLRVYEMRRLRYYYAVVTCDSVETASHIYDECDGIEFESTSAKIDLRFIPDDLTFNEEPRDECHALPEAGKYIPQYFATSALAQSNFELTWDETDPRRINLNKRLWSSKEKDVDAEALQNYLASSSGDDSAEEGLLDAEKYRALLKNEDTDNGTKEMEITWGIDLQSRVDEKSKEKMRKEANLGEMTPFEEMMQKKKDKSKQKRLAKLSKNKDESTKDDTQQEAPFSDDELPSDFEDLKLELTREKDAKQKKGKGEVQRLEEPVDERQKAELELLTMDEDDARHFNLSTRLPKKAQTADGFEVDVKDPRFSAMFFSHHYNLDPSNPLYKDTKANRALAVEKLRMKDKTEEMTPKVMQKKSSSAELLQLVKTVKRKAEENRQNFRTKKMK